MEAFLAKSTSFLNICGQVIPFCDQAEHVGTVRQVHGNLAHLLARFTAHRKAIFAILPVGLAKEHRGNPAACIKAHNIYAVRQNYNICTKMYGTVQSVRYCTFL